jgi:hypothetical protein
MSRAPPTFRKRNVRVAIEAAKAAGVPVGRVEIDKDGKITIIAGKPDCDELGNPWDADLKEMEEK